MSASLIQGRGLVAVCALGYLLVASPSAAEKPHQLPIGDEARREKKLEPRLDVLLDSRTGEQLTPSQLPAQLASTRLLLIGEAHTREEFHRVQEMVLRELHKAGRKVLIGLEMMPTDQQATLDRWVAGELSEQAYLETANWYEHWGYNWEYYRPIFTLARSRKLAMRGLNVPRKLVRKARQEGFDSLEEEDRRRLPPEIQPSTESYQRLFLSYFDDSSGMHSLTGETLEGFLRAQTAWDASMAWASVQALQADPEAIVVVLVGAGHVAYDLGIARQAAPFLEGEIRTLIPVPVSEDGEPVLSVSASYADYVWGVAEEPWERFPSLGVSTRAGEEGEREVLFVGEDSPAATIDIAVGDILLTIDGQVVDKSSVIRKVMAGKRWGDTVHLSWQRGGEEVSGTVNLRRTGLDR